MPETRATFKADPIVGRLAVLLGPVVEQSPKHFELFRFDGHGATESSSSSLNETLQYALGIALNGA
jgi:hypothetical protein